MNRRLFLACLSAAFAKASAIKPTAPPLLTFAEYRRLNRPIPEPNWTPAERLAILRADLEGHNAYFEKRPYEPNPYSFETQPDLWGGFVHGWIMAKIQAKKRNGAMRKG